jgi:hypothetical protein
VFGDEPLAVEIRQVEKDFRQGRIANLAESLATPIHQRYEMKSASESEKRERHE